MRPLWPIERAVVDATAQDYPHLAEALMRQMESAQVAKFENTGGGFFSTVTVAAASPPLLDKSPLDGAHGTVKGMEYGMGFLIFLEDGRMSLIEGYSEGGDDTTGIDFEHVEFEVRPWGAESR
jgi:hypothetical protein